MYSYTLPTKETTIVYLVSKTREMFKQFSATCAAAIPNVPPWTKNSESRWNRFICRGANPWPQLSPAGSKQGRCERAFLRLKWRPSSSRHKPESSARQRTHRTRRYCCKPVRRFSIIWTVYDHSLFFMEKEYRPHVSVRGVLTMPRSPASHARCCLGSLAARTPGNLPASVNGIHDERRL
jgi:hypothetical protein